MTKHSAIHAVMLLTFAAAMVWGGVRAYAMHDRHQVLASELRATQTAIRKQRVANAMRLQQWKAHVARLEARGVELSWSEQAQTVQVNLAFTEAQRRGVIAHLAQEPVSAVEDRGQALVVNFNPLRYSIAWPQLVSAEPSLPESARQDLVLLGVARVGQQHRVVVQNASGETQRLSPGESWQEHTLLAVESQQATFIRNGEALTLPLQQAKKEERHGRAEKRIRAPAYARAPYPTVGLSESHAPRSRRGPSY